MLRRAQAADAGAIAAIWSDPHVTRYMGGPRDFETIRLRVAEEASAGATAQGTGWWCAVEKASGNVAGNCGLVEKTVDGRDEIELIYVFAAEHWGKGYATEAAAALRDYAVRQVGLRRLIALIDRENRASARVAEKIGMGFERETRRPNGRVMRVYSLSATG